MCIRRRILRIEYEILEHFEYNAFPGPQGLGPRPQAGRCFEFDLFQDVIKDFRIGPGPMGPLKGPLREYIGNI